MKRAFISGITGQDGAYLALNLLNHGYEVHGGARRASNSIHHRLEALGVAERVKLWPFELTDPECMVRVVREVMPHEFYNLAAQSFVGGSWQYPAFTSAVDGFGVLHLLEALRNHAPECRFYQASTSEMFGLVRQSPQSEQTPFHPRSPYGVAKLYADWMTGNYRESHGMHAVSGILFNHESPVRGREFVTRKITLQLARIAHGHAGPLSLGNLDSRRDWGHAEEYVEGMRLMLQQPVPEDFVLATGISSSVRDFASHAARFAGFDLGWVGSGEDEKGVDRRTGRVIINVDPSFYRPAEVDHLLGDSAKAQKLLGWKPRIDVKTLAEAMYRADYDRVQAGHVLF